MKQKIQIVILTAGFGSRLRPLTWSKPKPLVAIAGRTSLDYLLDEFKDLSNDWEPEYIFVISPNGWSIKTYMEENYPNLNCKYVIQEEMKGQSHAVYCAKDLIDSPMIMTFADTLIHVDLSVLKDEQRDGLAWCQYTEDPRLFGAAVLDENGRVQRFIEKPESMEHKMVIVGFYYFKDGKKLISAIEEQIEKNISLKNEFYIADGINVMLSHDADFGVEETTAWVDAGVPGTVISTNRFFLDQGNDNSAEAAKREGVVIIPPVYVDPSAEVTRSVIGPYVSIAAGCKVTNCVLQDTILDKRTSIANLVAHETMLGADVDVNAADRKLFLGDNCKAEL